MTKTYDVRGIANEFLKEAKRFGVALTNMQVQKMPYILDCWSHGILGRGIISEPAIKTEHGVIYQSLYNSLIGYGSGPVQNPICYRDVLSNSDYKGGDSDTLVPPTSTRGGVVYSDIEKDDEAYKLLSLIFSFYWHTPVQRVNEEINLTAFVFPVGHLIPEKRLQNVYGDLVDRIKTCSVINQDAPVFIDVYTRFLEWQSESKAAEVESIREFYKELFGK